MSALVSANPADPAGAGRPVPGGDGPADAANSAAWRRRRGAAIALRLLCALLLPCLVYAGTARSIVAIWQRSDTYAHGFVVLPISVWLIWRRRAQLLALAPRPCWPALGALLACGTAWLLAGYGDVQIARQYAFAAMLPLSALALLGAALARRIAFALLFMLLAVPFGESFIEPLIGVTADLTVAALRLSGVPVLREGNSFSIPSGNWSVVEACSGLRYLIASLTLGCLYAHLSYTTRRRQLLFVGLCALVPVAANGARAYLIVMIAHLSDMKLAVGVDHLVYGWLFFGLVMLLLFYVGGWWRETVPQVSAPPPASGAEPAPARTGGAPMQLAALLLGLAASLSMWPAYAAYQERLNAGAVLTPLDGFLIGAPAAAPFTDWRAEFAPATLELRRFYAGAGAPLGLHLLYYGDRRDGPKLVSSRNLLLPQQVPGWRQLGSAPRAGTVAQKGVGGGPRLDVRETLLAGPQGRLLVWSWYWIDGRRTASDYAGKLLQVREKLLVGSNDGAAVILFAAYDEHPEAAREVLRQFLAGHLTALERALAGVRRPL